MAKTLVKKQPVKTRLSLDYPLQGETITYPQYTVRVSAPAAAQAVEIAIDDGDWRPCRQACGHWWHDWSGYDNGEHEIVARIVLKDGKAVHSEPHEFFVRL